MIDFQNTGVDLSLRIKSMTYNKLLAKLDQRFTELHTLKKAHFVLTKQKINFIYKGAFHVTIY